MKLELGKAVENLANERALTSDEISSDLTECHKNRNHSFVMQEYH